MASQEGLVISRATGANNHVHVSSVRAIVSGFCLDMALQYEAATRRLYIPPRLGQIMPSRGGKTFDQRRV
ncbi:hypothetical protein JTE90_026409 [Oedothorax gibbosus]|uniref:Uncharacterized protein n=1 Tax=Oedothorax gibbosus TaxID=931172 RepID=A0AAV6TH27_9ARAC|nr:hypothetical protein JTE90_026409 [Oedothorax gibbosus]